MRRNTPTVQDIADDPRRLKDLPLTALAQLTEEAKSLKGVAEVVGKAINSELENRFGDAFVRAYAIEQKDTGTVHVEANGFDLEASRTKKVDWDQARLAALASHIKASGDDPAQYLKITYAVEERAYNAWPDYLKAQVEPARTVRPGPLTIKMNQAKAVQNVRAA